MANKISGLLTSFRVYIGLAPKTLPKTLPFTVDFSTVATQSFDLTKEIAGDKLEWVQSFYVDNSANPMPLVLTMQDTGQVITWPANSQGYMPVLAINPPKFTLSTTVSSGLVINIQALSFAVPAAIWSIANAGIGVTGTDGSTTITAGGTAQNLFGGTIPANGFAIYNPDPANDLWVSDTTTALANGTGSIRVPANGGAYETPVGYKPIAAVSIVGGVTGQKITAKRW